MDFLKKLIFHPVIASFIVAFGWQWYHFSRHSMTRFWMMTILLSLVIFTLYKLAKKLFQASVIKWHKHSFWYTDFFDSFDELFVIFSLYFLVFFSKFELLNLIYFCLISILLFWRLDKQLSKHPARGWQRVARQFFILVGFIFITNTFFQYFAFSHYILDSNIKFYNIVLFRSVGMAVFWLCGFSISSLFFIYFSGKIRSLFLIFWIVFFILSILIGFINVAILYHSGLYISPVVIKHAGGGGTSIFLLTGIFTIVSFLISSTIFLFIIKRFFNEHKISGKRYWYHFNFVIVGLAILVFLSIASFRNTPEALIIKSFLDRWNGNYLDVELEPVVKEKLERFGIHHDLDSFYINHKDSVFNNDKKLLSDKFVNKKPNVVFVFLESFSSRLTDVYNLDLINVTPGLTAMVNDKNTTKFSNYFNASTPTVTGLISQLCSLLPPMGHDEIEHDGHLQKHHLLCLPEVLKDAGYKSSLYITAVDINFANKGAIFKSMKTDDAFGTKELSKIIDGEPLSWGYSDHQLFPAMFSEMKNRKIENKEPFLMMLSTVDTHPPFNLAKDTVEYKDGKNDVLNAVHTTDDAFLQFWNEFKSSEFYDDTIVVAVADHAIFPTAYDKKYFPNEVGKMTFYDENVFLMYVPDSILPKDIDIYSSGIDLTPTLLHVLNINPENSFEGHSIFDDRKDYQNVLGMHEFGLFINQDLESSRKVDFILPNSLYCESNDISKDLNSPLTLCEYNNYFQWKRRMFEDGRLWFGNR